MTNTPKKTQDPTEAALSAIEEALNLGEQAAANPAPAEPRLFGPRESGLAPAPAFPAESRAAEDELFSDQPRPVRRLEGAARRAANDNRQSVGQILAALHHKPSPVPFYLAGALAALWFIVGIFLGYSRVKGDIATTTRLIEIIALPNFWPFLATLVFRRPACSCSPPSPAAPRRCGPSPAP